MAAEVEADGTDLRLRHEVITRLDIAHDHHRFIRCILLSSRLFRQHRIRRGATTPQAGTQAAFCRRVTISRSTIRRGHMREAFLGRGGIRRTTTVHRPASIRRTVLLATRGSLALLPSLPEIPPEIRLGTLQASSSRWRQLRLILAQHSLPLLLARGQALPATTRSAPLRWSTHQPTAMTRRSAGI